MRFSKPFNTQKWKHNALFWILYQLAISQNINHMCILREIKKKVHQLKSGYNLQNTEYLIIDIGVNFKMNKKVRMPLKK